jgi:hypothetical protein
VTTATANGAPARHHLADITVNNAQVPIEGPRATGLQIKQAAIDTGVEIQLSFQLTEELGGNRTRVVGDAEEVSVQNHPVFTANADDDNS